MNLLEQFLSSGDGNAVGQLSAQFGLDPQQTQAAIAQLLPALAGGLQQQAQSGGLENLPGMMGGTANDLVHNPGALAQPDAAEFGQGILGQLFGGGDALNAVAERASSATGISPAILQQMLPVVATMLIGFLGRQQGNALAMGASPDALPGEGLGGIEGMLGGLLGGVNNPGGGLMDAVSGFAGQNRDKSMLDDLLGMLSQRFKG